MRAASWLRWRPFCSQKVVRADAALVTFFEGSGAASGFAQAIAQGCAEAARIRGERTEDGGDGLLIECAQAGEETLGQDLGLLPGAPVEEDGCGRSDPAGGQHGSHRTSDVRGGRGR